MSSNVSTTENLSWRMASSLWRFWNISIRRLKSSRRRTDTYTRSTPHLAENLCGLQVKQFRKKYGIVENVSDREYVSNGFHCHVTEDITPIQKQDLEYRFWELSNGGKIQYVKYPISYNREAVKTLVRRAMDMGFYEGVNLSLAYCDDCGHEEAGYGCLSGLRQPEPDQDRPYERLSFLLQGKGRHAPQRRQDGGDRREKKYVNNGLPVAPNVRLERFLRDECAMRGGRARQMKKHYEKEDRCDIII